jgi:hypothetical protein
LEKAAFPVFLMVALGIGTPVSLRANPADILLVDSKIVTWDATSSISDALASATGSGAEIRKLAVPANGAS